MRGFQGHQGGGQSPIPAWAAASHRDSMAFLLPLRMVTGSSLLTQICKCLFGSADVKTCIDVGSQYCFSHGRWFDLTYSSWLSLRCLEPDGHDTDTEAEGSRTVCSQVQSAPWWHISGGLLACMLCDSSDCVSS